MTSSNPNQLSQVAGTFEESDDLTRKAEVVASNPSPTGELVSLSSEHLSSEDSNLKQPRLEHPSSNQPSWEQPSWEQPVPGRHRPGLPGVIPVYYGWVMLPVAMLAMVASSPGQTYGVTIFNKHFQEDLQLSETRVTGAYLLGTLLGSFALPLVGWLMDHYGLRWTLMGVVIGFGAACVVTSWASGFLTLLVAFVLLRMLGQGALTLLANNTLAMWFHTRLGLANGLASLSVAGAMAATPPLFLALIHQLGWRGAYVVLGVAIWVILLPVVVFVYRNRPEDIGQLPDGDLARDEAWASGAHTQNAETKGTQNEGGQAANQDHPSQRPELQEPLPRQFDLPAAVGTRSFWLLMAMNGSFALVATGVTFTAVSLLGQRGLSELQAAATFSTFALGFAGANLVGGVLADRMKLNRLLSHGALLAAAGLGILLAGHGWLAAHGYALLFASGCALMLATANVAWPRYFGRAHLGQLRGIYSTVAVAGSSLGPFVMGLNNDWLGSYDLSLMIFLLWFAGLAVVMLYATPPQSDLVETTPANILAKGSQVSLEVDR